METNFANEIPDGKVLLSGIDTVAVKVGFYGEDSTNGIVIQLNGKNYLCYEDPEDGYRSCSIFQEVSSKCKYTFPPQPVFVEHYNVVINEYGYEDSNHGIKIYNDNKELILQVGTDHYDDYYPMAVFEWHPENLPINKNRE